MTVETEHRRIQYTGNDSIRTYYFDFEVPEEEYLFVIMSDSFTTAYTASGIGDQNGGSILFNEDVTISGLITIYREVDYVQETDYVEGGLFRAETHEDTFDYSRFVDQQLKETVDRCIRLDIDDPNSGANLIIPADRDGTFIRFDENFDLTLVEDADLNLWHNHDGRYAFNPHGDESHTEDYLIAAEVTMNLLVNNGIVGTGGDQVAYGNHNHDGVYMREDHNHDNAYAPKLHGNENHTSVFITDAGVTFESLNTKGDVGKGSNQLAVGSHVHDLHNMPTTDGEWFGQGVIGYAGELLGFGDVLCVNSSGHFIQAEADDNVRMPAAAIAIDTGSGTEFSVLLQGVVRVDAWNWNPGYVIFVSTTRGNFTQTYPTGLSNMVQPVGVALTSNVVFFNPNYIMLTRSV